MFENAANYSHISKKYCPLTLNLVQKCTKISFNQLKTCIFQIFFVPLQPLSTKATVLDSMTLSRRTYFICASAHEAYSFTNKAANFNQRKEICPRLLCFGMGKRGSVGKLAAFRLWSRLPVSFGRTNYIYEPWHNDTRHDLTRSRV